MNLSLTNRVKISFVMTNLIILIIGFLMYFFLGSLASNIKRSWSDFYEIRKIEEVVTADLVELTALGMELDKTGKRREFKSRIQDLQSNIELLKVKYTDERFDDVLSSILDKTKTLGEYIGETESLENQNRLKEGSFHINLLKKVSGDFLKYIRKSQEAGKDISEQVDNSIVLVKKNMLLVLILAFLGTILLGWLVPRKVALPFKKINHAIRELQNCNFDVSIFYDEKDEIGELARELNKMISQLKLYEELRADKFLVESKKFNIIANHIKKNILIVNSEGKLSYMNNSLYSILKLETGDVLDKEIENSAIPESIVDVFKKALKIRGKIENEEVRFSYKKIDENEEEVNVEFSGYGEVFPIRGKESSLDYYLMFINEEMTA